MNCSAMNVKIYYLFRWNKSVFLTSVLKKFAAILLIILFAFNLVGYRIYFYVAQCRSDKALEQNFDKDIYNENQLISVTVSFPMPYQHNSDGFERCDGEIAFNGKLYKFVKRKYADGSMTFLCLPDQNKMNLEDAKNAVTSNLNDLQGNGKNTGNSKADWARHLTSDYTKHDADARFSLTESIHTHFLFDKRSDLSTGPHNSPEQPPELG